MLMKTYENEAHFYGVNTPEELVEALLRHIKDLQEKINPGNARLYVTPRMNSYDTQY